MRKIALIMGVICLGILVALLIKEPSRVENLDGLIVGEVVSIEGVVDEERKFGTGKLLIIDEVPVFCECFEKYSGSKVYVEGIIEKFPEDLRIRAFKIRFIS